MGKSHLGERSSVPSFDEVNGPLGPTAEAWTSRY